MKQLLIVLFAINPFLLAAQMTDHAWLEANNIHARINADGRLFCDDTAGAFFVPRGDSMTTLMRAAGLWLGGTDPAGNLLMSAQMYLSDSSDYTAGFRGIPNSGRVWKVTRSEVEAHRRDYLEDGVVDNPIPSIFGWPGRHNDLFEKYNGFHLPDSMALGGFYEPESDLLDGKYEPNRGEFPQIGGARALSNKWTVPDELIFFAFHTDGPQNLIKTVPFPVQVWGEAYVFHCPENDILENSVFVTYRWRFEGGERADTVTAAVFADVDLGNSKDDYHGYLPEKNLYFVYNADDTDEGGWGQELPEFFIQSVYQPVNGEGYTIDFHLMPFTCSDGCSWLSGASYPRHPAEYFNYLTGSWRDGSPLVSGGQGYQTGGIEMPGAFPGLPDANAAWTELNAQNPPGNRRALLRHYLGNASPEWINSMTLIFGYIPPDVASASMAIQGWQYAYYAVQNEFNCCTNFINPPPFPDCAYDESWNPEIADLAVYPNPVSDVLKIWHKGLTLKSLRLFDTLGLKRTIGNHIGFISEVQVHDLPMGIYFLEIIDETGSKTVKKIMVAH